MNTERKSMASPLKFLLFMWEGNTYQAKIIIPCGNGRSIIGTWRKETQTALEL